MGVAIDQLMEQSDVTESSVQGIKLLFRFFQVLITPFVSHDETGARSGRMCDNVII